MSSKNFMSYDDAATVLGEYADAVNELKSGLTNVDVALSVPDGTGKNIFDKNGSLENGKYIQANGTITASTNWNTTDYQQITPNTYTMSGATEGEGGYYGICWYDSEKNYISGFQKFSTSPQTVTIPSNAKYVRYSVNNSSLDSFMLEQGSTATVYTPYIPSVDSRIEAVESGLTNVSPMLSNVTISASGGISVFLDNLLTYIKSLSLQSDVYYTFAGVWENTASFVGYVGRRAGLYNVTVNVTDGLYFIYDNGTTVTKKQVTATVVN